MEDLYSDRNREHYQTLFLVEFLMPKYTRKRRKLRISRQSVKRRNKRHSLSVSETRSSVWIDMPLRLETYTEIL